MLLFSGASTVSRLSTAESDDVDANIVDKLLGDIREGFTYKKHGDIGDFKVRQ